MYCVFYFQSMSIFCKREPKRLDLHLCYRTTGLPKGLMVLGNGVAVVTGLRSFFSEGSKNTRLLIEAEREVRQPCNLLANKYLSYTGMKKLAALGESCYTQKLFV